MGGNKDRYFVYLFCLLFSSFVDDIRKRHNYYFAFFSLIFLWDLLSRNKIILRIAAICFPIKSSFILSLNFLFSRFLFSLHLYSALPLSTFIAPILYLPVSLPPFLSVCYPPRTLFLAIRASISVFICFSLLVIFIHLYLSSPFHNILSF